MMQVIKKYGLFLILFVLFTGCSTIHEFPDDRPVEPSLIEVDITIAIDMRFYSYIMQTRAATQIEDEYDIRYIVDVYEVLNGNGNGNGNNGLGRLVTRIVRTEEDIIAQGVYEIQETLRLSAGEYRLLTWIDFVQRGTEYDVHHNAGNLHNISLLPQNGQHVGFRPTRDAFTARYNLDLTPYEGQRYVSYLVEKEAQRPFAKYRIIATDIEAFRAYHQQSYVLARPAQTNLAYNLFFPLGYNVNLFQPTNFTAGKTYSYNIVDDESEQELIIASNFVFMGDDTFYLVDFEILGADGRVINTINGLRINLRRNHITIIRGEFLTRDLDGTGIGIDDGFSEEIIIRI